MEKTKSGFTIVELLIVIVVIGILAAITVVAFTGIQQRARASVAQSDLASLTKAVELRRVDNARYTDSLTYRGALQDTSLYDQTAPGGPKTFVICANDTEFLMIAFAPIITGDNMPAYYSGSETSGSFNWAGGVAGESTATTACNAAPINYTFVTWTHNPGVRP